MNEAPAIDAGRVGQPAGRPVIGGHHRDRPARAAGGGQVGLRTLELHFLFLDLHLQVGQVRAGLDAERVSIKIDRAGWQKLQQWECLSIHQTNVKRASRALKYLSASTRDRVDGIANHLRSNFRVIGA